MKHPISLKNAFVGILALFLTVSILTACGGGDPNEKEAKALTKQNIESRGYDAPSATVRAFFEALAAGKLQVAESMAEADNLSITKRYINTCIERCESIWIAPNSYMMGEGNMAAADYATKKTLGYTREVVLLIKNGDVWKIRFQDTGAQYATSIPAEISEKNDKLFVKDEYVVNLK